MFNFANTLKNDGVNNYSNIKKDFKEGKDNE